MNKFLDRGLVKEAGWLNNQARKFLKQDMVDFPGLAKELYQRYRTKVLPRYLSMVGPRVLAARDAALNRSRSLADMRRVTDLDQELRAIGEATQEFVTGANSGNYDQHLSQAFNGVKRMRSGAEIPVDYATGRFPKEVHYPARINRVIKRYNSIAPSGKIKITDQDLQ